MRTSFSFWSNGWKLTVYFWLKYVKQIEPIYECEYNIIGITNENKGKINIETSVLDLIQNVEINPYVDGGKTITINKIKIPKETLQQIKAYLL